LNFQILKLFNILVGPDSAGADQIGESRRMPLSSGRTLPGTLQTAADKARIKAWAACGDRVPIRKKNILDQMFFDLTCRKTIDLALGQGNLPQ
jgi:hypothetical protein